MSLPARPARMRSGIIVCLVIFAVGLITLGGLFLAPRPKSPPAPAEAIWGAPSRPLRIVSYNILHNQRGMQGVIDEIKKLNPDFVLIQEVEADHVIDMAEG